MKSFRVISFIICAIFSFNLSAQVPADYFQQTVNYKIRVTLDDNNHEIEGDIFIEYVNQSPDTLKEIYMHLWANAFSDKNTAFAKQQLRNKDTKFHFASQNEYGNYRNLKFNIDGQDVQTRLYENNKDIVILSLSEPLIPGDRIRITTPLELKIPKSFSRLGHIETSYQMTQWYPKPAVYDKKGWHPMPYYTMGEFYSEFGSFDVQITLPENYYVGATGTLRTQSEIDFIEKRIKETKKLLSDTSRISNNEFPESSKKMKTIRYTADNVHDFAWFADKRYYIEKGQVDSKGKSIDTYVFYTDFQKNLWKKGLSYVDRAVEFYSEKVGAYPYPHATAVQSALSAGAGMEYPMITVIGGASNAKSLDQVITHEVGHNWFYGILAFNERDYPWMDEGINSYYDHRYLSDYYISDPSDEGPKFITNNLEMPISQMALYFQTRRGLDQKSSLHSNKFGMLNYGLMAYEKPALAFEHLYRYLGQNEFDKIMQDFYTDWKFKHPQPEDIIYHFNKNSSKDLSWFWKGVIGSNYEVDYKIQKVSKRNEAIEVTVKNKGKIAVPYAISTFSSGKNTNTTWVEGHLGSKTTSLPVSKFDEIMIDTSFLSLDVNLNNNYKKNKIRLPKIGFFTSFDQSKKKQLYLYPSFGYNTYDGLMLGLGLNNLTVPMPRLKFNIISMYGFRSKKIVGNAYLEYLSAIKGDRLLSIKYSLFSKQFSLRSKHYQTGEKVLKNNDYGTIVPRIQFNFNHEYNTLRKSSLTLKSTLINVTQRKLNDEKSTKSSSYTELIYKLRNLKVLTPNSLTLRAEWQNYNNIVSNSQTNSVRLDATYNIAYQYKKSRFLRARVFGAVFPYHQDKSTSNFNPGNIYLSQNGLGDYKYEDYYFGRNEISGGFASQLLVNQGGLKLPGIENYPHLLGATNLAAVTLGLEGELPIKKVGKFVRLYADIGWAARTKFNSDDIQQNILASSGIKLSLWDVVDIYFPILQTKNLREIYPNYKNRISFSIDLNKIEPIGLYQNFDIN